jgi:hypothetical protein
MVGNGDVGLLKVGRRRPKSANRAEAGLAILWKILSIAFGGGPDPQTADAPSCQPTPTAAEIRPLARSDCCQAASGVALRGSGGCASACRAENPLDRA